MSLQDYPEALALLVRDLPPNPQEIAPAVTQVLRRIQRVADRPWYKATGTLPATAEVGCE